MTRRGGSADLPLHGGRVPAWLADRMTRLGAVMSEAIVHEYGRDELLRRLAHPFWFQSFGAVMGMDWHSSGITTSVIGALKRGLAPLAGDEIQTLLSLWSDSQRASAEVKALAEAHAAELQDRIAEMQAMQRTLLNLAALYSRGSISNTAALNASSWYS